MNAVGGHDGYEGELVFDGYSLIYGGDSKIRAVGRNFGEALFVVDPFGKSSIECEALDATQELFEALVLGIRDYARRCGFKRAVVGLSGGGDSALVAALAVKALGAKSVSGITLPARFSSRATREDAARVAHNLGIEFVTLSIEEVFKSYEAALGEPFEKLAVQGGDTTFENIQARIRGTLLMAYSNRTGSLLLSTGNKTELALGYCTLYGDMSGGLAVISDVSKDRVYALADYINRCEGRDVIPRSVIERAPTAELKSNQTDEAGLGAPYKILSPLVDEIVEADSAYTELIRKYPKEVVESVTERIRRNEFKRRQAPPGIRVTEKAFGIGRRVPMSY